MLSKTLMTLVVVIEETAPVLPDTVEPDAAFKIVYVYEDGKIVVK